jgi:uncharacterized protein involved in response to NO
MKTSLFAYGFRPHFLLAGIAGLLLVPLWASSYVFGTPLGTAWPPTLWHAHEMLFGFVASAIAGFLLTAVPSWTGQKGFAGRPLVLLAALWIAARIAIASSDGWPAWLVTALDLAFLPALTLLVARPLLHERNRNTPLLLVLALLWACNVLFHLALARHDPPLASRALLLGIDIVLVLTTVIGGRIIPAFTNASFRQRGVPYTVASRPLLTIVAVASMVLVAVGDAVWPDSAVAGALAGIAALAQAARLLQWGTLRTLRQPIVWVLHLGYAWMPVGLALKAAALLQGPAISAFWLHALTVGTLATLILAVMTRASLGHTGRPLVVDPLVTLSYVLLSAAGVVRVFGLSGLGMNYLAVIAISALCWTAALALFVAIYGPILCSARLDGKPG